MCSTLDDMTTTPPDTSSQGSAPDSGPRVGWDDVRDLARIRRSRADRKIAGVAGGLGRHLDVDPIIVRVAFVVLTFFGGVGLLLYVALWLLLPEDGKDWATIKLDRRSRTAALVVIGIFAVFLLLSHGWWGSPGPLFYLAAIVGAIVVALQLTRRDRPPAGPTTTAPSTSPTAYAVAPDLAPDATAPAPPPPSYVVAEQPRPVNPRKKGPILFWFALAVMGVALGTLAIANLAGAHVAPSAYPATALAVSAVFLLVGSFYGRAGGIILVGLLAACVTIGTTIADRWDPHHTAVVPVDAAQVHDTYSIDVGELVVDLTDVSDPKSLDGRVITVTGNVGHLDIQVPDDITVVAHTHVTGVGGMNVFGRGGGGVDTVLTNTYYAGPHAPRVTIDADLHVGGIDVHTEPDDRRSLR
jgi:phage shock protein PspC (stress-responsive transcriptional regulator)